MINIKMEVGMGLQPAKTRNLGRGKAGPAQRQGGGQQAFDYCGKLL
jgi:hypothetical protein